MDPLALPSVRDYFADLPDPRTGPALRHDLLDVVTVTVLAVLCGADSWVDVELFVPTGHAAAIRYTRFE